MLSVRIPRPRSLLPAVLAVGALFTRSAYAQLEISPDGACGNGVTCLNSRWGQCCSPHGYCGDSIEYCGDGCNSAFGNCGLNGGVNGGGVCNCPTAIAPAPTCRTTVTGTRWMTQTSTISVTVEETQVYLQTIYSTVTVTTIRATTTKPQAAATPSLAIPGAVKDCRSSSGEVGGSLSTATATDIRVQARSGTK